MPAPPINSGGRGTSAASACRAATEFPDKRSRGRYPRFRALFFGGSNGCESTAPPVVLSSADMVWIDEVADRFEVAWRSGDPPAIAAFLGGAAGPRREALVRELVRVDLACRRRRGDSPCSNAIFANSRNCHRCRPNRWRAWGMERRSRQWPAARRDWVTFAFSAGSRSAVWAKSTKRSKNRWTGGWPSRSFARTTSPPK